MLLIHIMKWGSESVTTTIDRRFEQVHVVTELYFRGSGNLSLPHEQHHSSLTRLSFCSAAFFGSLLRHGLLCVRSARCCALSLTSRPVISYIRSLAT